MRNRQGHTERGRTDTVVRRRGSFAQLRILPALMALLAGATVLGEVESSLSPTLPLPGLLPLYTKALRFTNEVRLRVESPDVQYQIGEQLLLFDVNSDYFVGIREDQDRGMNELVAFPRISETGDGTAWITNEKQLIFGTRVRSTEGVLIIRRGETMPIIQEGSQSLTLLFQRFGRQARITVPRQIGSSLIEPATPPTELFMAHEAAEAARRAAQQQSEPVRTLSKPVLPASIARANRAPQRQPPTVSQVPPSPPIQPGVARTDPGTQVELAEVEVPAGLTVTPTPTPEQKPLLVATPPTATPPAVAVVTPPPTPAPPPAVAVAAIPTPPVAPPTAPPVEVATTLPAQPLTPAPPVTESKPAPPPAPPPAPTNALAAAASGTTSNAEPALAMVIMTSNEAKAVASKVVKPATPSEPPGTFRTFLAFNSWTFWVLVITVGLEGAMIARLLLKKKIDVPATDAGNQVFSFSSVGESVMDTTAESFVTGTNGDLQGELDKFSMGHVVQFFHSAGESGTLTISGGNGRVDKLIFDRGQIIDAMSGNRCGDAAAEIILRRKQGSFKFTREDNSKRLRLINQDTMGMLMEAARVIDEKGWSD